MIGFARPQRVYPVVSECYRMSLRHKEDWDELYYLGNDPRKVRNLYDEADARPHQQAFNEIMLQRVIECRTALRFQPIEHERLAADQTAFI